MRSWRPFPAFSRALVRALDRGPPAADTP